MMTIEPARLMLERAALSIVDGVVDLPDAEMRARIDTECGADAVLRGRVQQLMGEIAKQTSDVTGFNVFIQPTLLVPPDRIGHFRIVEVIGQGGMGLVCRAARDDGLFEQTVAIKLLHPVLRSVAAFEHFFRERKILARLDHPAIVGLLDGGDHEGRPYLVMPFVDGNTLMDHVRRNALPLAARLELFGAIVDAVIYAHQQLIVHADLKPSNVLVDQQGQVRLLDFGIARLLGEHTVQDEPAVGFTEGYAAPERQAGGPATVVGDVYSLGVILFQLLCDRLPDTNTIPGQLLPASTCSDDPLIDRSDIKGDLDAIISRALAHNPQDRYPDVGALSRDLQRFAKHLPVSAHSAGWRYVARKFLRRNRRRLLLTGVVGTLMISAAVFSTVQYLETALAHQEADRRFFEVRRLVHYLLFVLYDQLANSPGTTAARVEVADTARRYLEQLVDVDAAPADLRLDVARSYIRLAGVLGLSGTSSLGKAAEAGAALGTAESILADLAAEQATTEVLIEVGNLLNSRWTLLADNEASEVSNANAAATFRRVLHLEPENQRALLGWLTTERNRGFGLLWTHDDPVAAAAALSSTITQLRAAKFSVADLSRSAGTLEIQVLTRLGDALYYTGDSRSALVSYREAEALVRGRLSARETPSSLDQLGDLLFNISAVQAENKQELAGALVTAQEGVRIMEKVLGYGPDASAEKRLLVLLGQEATVLSTLGRHDEAVVSSQRSVTLRETRQRAEPDNPMRRRDLAIGLGTHAEVLIAAGLINPGCVAVEQALLVWGEIEARGQLSVRDLRRNRAEARAQKTRFCAGGSA